jgi:LAGLIDADG endonuclease
LLYEFRDLTDVKALPTKLSELNWHITGFTEGDASFPIVLSPVPDKKFGWLIQPRFEIELRNNRDCLTTLKIIQRAIGFKSVIDNLDSSIKFNVTNRLTLLEKVIPFFNRYKPALKRAEFDLFRKTTESLEAKKHLQEDGFKQIVTNIFSLPLNSEQRRKWTFHDILPGDQQPQRNIAPGLIFPEGAALRHYVSGFIDAEGAFGFVIILESKTLTPYVTITHANVRMLQRVQQVLRAGNISTGRLQIYGVDAMTNKILPFLEKHQPITKHTSYREFKRILGLIEQGEHKRRFDEIVSMVRTMNDRGSSETIR